MTKQLIVVFGGDSLSSNDNSWTYQSIGVAGNGQDGSQVMQSTQCYRKSDGSILVMNMAVAGTRLNSTNGFPDLVPLAPSYIDPIVAHKVIVGSSSIRKYAFVNSMGTNDGATGGLGSVSAYAAANASATVDRKTAGFDFTVMGTLLPSNGGVLSEPNRTAYNSLLTDSGWRASHGIDYVVDLASETTMGNPATCSNTTYYVDGTHPTTAGYALLAPIAAGVWSTILASF
jgi:hypothetical protein